MPTNDTTQDQVTFIIRRNETDEVLLKVRGSTLRKINLSGTNLSGAALYAIEVRGSPRYRSPTANLVTQIENISGVCFRGADLSGAVLSGEEVVRADFTEANLRGAIFVRTHFISTKFDGADLTGARMMHTVFSNCPSLADANGLDSVEHRGPAVLDRNTLRAAISRLPRSFLLGCGYTTEEIQTFTRLYQGQDFFSCFISYARQDGDFAAFLRNRLIRNGISCWQDIHDLRGGEYWRQQIYEAIDKQDKLILVCSERALLRPSVVAEILEAIDRERRAKTQKLFPIRIDDYVLSDELDQIAKAKVTSGEWKENWVAYVRAYHIPDFSSWRSSRKIAGEFRSLMEALRQSPRR